MEALPHMHALLNTRPEGFDSIEEAIEWQYVFTKNHFLQTTDRILVLPSVNTRTINNPASARISVPSILVQKDSTLSPRTRANEVHEYRWRTPLRSTAPYWECRFLPHPFSEPSIR